MRAGPDPAGDHLAGGPVRVEEVLAATTVTSTMPRFIAPPELANGVQSDKAAAEDQHAGGPATGRSLIYALVRQ